MSKALHTEAIPTTDLAFGRGERFDVAGGQASLEIFPERQLSRITTPTSRLELFGSPAPHVIDGQVVISQDTGQEELNLSVSPEGTVVFGYVSTGRQTSLSRSTVTATPTAPEEPATAPQRPQEPLAEARAGVIGERAADRTPSEPLSPASSGAGLRPSAFRPHHPDGSGPGPDRAPTRTDHPTTEQQPRLQLTGRLGRDPSFRTSPRGTLVGRFPLAVHRDDGTTTWHSVLAFGERARQLQHRADAGEISKGQEVSLIGYQHTREQPTREGRTKTVTEIYAVAVTRR